MICSSVKLVRFIVRSQVGPDSNRRWWKNPVAGQYNTERLHSAIGYVTPEEAEEEFYEALNADEKAA